MVQMLRTYKLLIVDSRVLVRGLGAKKHDTGFVAVQVLREAYAKNNRVF